MCCEQALTDAEKQADELRTGTDFTGAMDATAFAHTAPRDLGLMSAKQPE